MSSKVKTIFMCAVSRPIFSNDGQLIFDGKIGIFSFISQVPAQRSSKNRMRGEIETKLIQSSTKSRTRDMIVHKILPAIYKKQMTNRSKQDNIHSTKQC